MAKAKIAIIGGSGVYNLNNTKIIEEADCLTPFGSPSDKITIAEINGKNVAFLPRHGKGHRLSPSEIPVKANMYALKSLGVEVIIAISAVGSLKEEIRPTDIVLPSQIIDRTKARDSSFFGNGIVGHIAFADPFCEPTRGDILKIIEKYIKDTNSDKRVFDNETLVCVEGPAFSTRAESNLYRSWSAGIIGMTALPEAKLAREAEMCYVNIAMSTDYDCWKEDEDSVGVSMVVEYMKDNNRTIAELLPLIVSGIDENRGCECRNAVEFAIMTDMSIVPKEIKSNLELFYGKYRNK
jgi:5'-methylthioadenosine phosphorylase